MEYFISFLYQVSSQNSPEAEGSPESLSWFVKVMFEAIQILPAPSRRSHVISEVFKAWRENIQALSEEFDDPLEDDQGTVFGVVQYETVFLS